MCRWLAYTGDSIPIALLVLQPKHSLIDQSLHSRLGATTTNGDGFGVGWYDGEQEEPGVYRSVHPAWNDRNLRELATHVRSPLFFAHIRASTGTAVQETNCHPFRHGRWLFMHNGLVRGFELMKRDLLLAVDPSLVPAIEGSADSEVLFFLALTFGLEDDPVAALERMAGFVEATGERHRVADPLQMSVAVTNGVSVFAARYSSEGSSRSLYFSDSARAMKQRFPDDERFQSLSDDARAIVSEPLGDVAENWHEVPESTAGVVEPDVQELRPFAPRV
ncbi:MAG TPA: class II glutamine amidotransferase [Gaiellaceae bacterium]|nr:class II glutamine amidotransferase [Gaiellaceae bacterium]